MRIESDSHQYGEVVIENAFPEEHASLIDAMSSLPIPLRPLKPFTHEGRPREPKRHTRTIAGERLPFLLPVDQAQMNRDLEAVLRRAGWSTQPIAKGNMFGRTAPLGLKGDFVRNKVFVEVEFGNIASMHRDFFKFQIANRAGAGEAAVLVCATERLAKFFDSGVTTFEAARRHIPYLAIGIQMPIWFLGFEPTNWEPIRERYEDMRTLCEENDVVSHSFDAALGAEVDVSIPPSGDVDKALGADVVDDGEPLRPE
jgi:hypothetical protein